MQQVTEGAQIIIALIGVLGGLIATIGSVLIAQLNRTRQHTKATRDQVENDHSTNLRVEQDQRHEENARGIHILIRAVEGVQSDIRTIRTDVSGLMRGQAEQADAIHELEITQNPYQQASRFAPRDGKHRQEKHP